MTTAAPQVGERTRGAARAVLALAVAEVVGKLSTFAVMVVAARVLGQQGFGTFSYALALALLGATAVTWGFDTVVTRTGSRSPELLPGAYADLVALRVGISAVGLGGLALVLFAAGGLEQAGPVLLLLSASAALDALGDAGRAAAAALGKQATVAGVLVAQRAVTAAVALGLLAAGGGLLGLGLGFLAGSAVGTAVMLTVVARTAVRLDLRLARPARCLQLVKDSFSVGVNGVVTTALFRVDAVLLGVLAGSVAVGRYAAAYRLLETVMFVNWAVARAVFPLMAAATEPWQVRRAVERGVTVCAFVFAPYSAVLLLRGDDVLGLLYGAEFTGRGATVLAWLAAAPLLFGIAYLSSYALYALDRARVVLLASLGALVVNVGLNLLLVPPYGDVGAAVSTTVSYVVQAAVMTALLARAVGGPRLHRSVALPLLAVLPAVGVLLLTSLPVLLAAVASSSVYLLAWLLLSRRLDPEGLAVLRSLVPGGRS